MAALTSSAAPVMWSRIGLGPPSFPSFGVGDGFTAEGITLAVKYLADADASEASGGARRLRADYAKGETARLRKRLDLFTVRENDLVCAADDGRRVLPVELFSVAIVAAALHVYATSPPRAQAGNVDPRQVLAEVGRLFFAGVRDFGAVHLRHVELTLVSDIPHVDASSGSIGMKPSTSLSILLRGLSPLWTAALRNGHGPLLARLPARHWRRRGERQPERAEVHGHRA